MNRAKVESIILNAMEMTNHARENDNQIPVSATTELFGSQGYLDSMELVGLLVDIEESLLDEEVEISLSDDRAMSQAQSPFKNVQTLVDYIDLLMNESR